MALAIDDTTVARWTGTPNVNVDALSASFTPAADSLLVVCANADSASNADITVTVSGGGLTWAKRVEADIGTGDATGHASIWTAQVGASPSPMTIGVRQSQASGRRLSAKAYIIGGHDTATPVGSTGHGLSAVNNLTAAAYASTVAGSRALGCAIDWNALGLPASTDVADVAHYSGAISVLSLYKAADTAVSGTAVTVNFDAAGTGSPDWSWAAIEILPGPDVADVAPATPLRHVPRTQGPFVAPLGLGRSAPAATIPTTLIGQTTAGATSDFSSANELDATPFLAGTSGTLTTLKMVPKAASGTITSVDLAIYADNVGAPGALLGAARWTGSPTATTVITAYGLNVPIVAGTTYWLAWNPHGTGNFNFTGNAGTYYGRLTQASPPDPFGTSGVTTAAGAAIPAIWAEGLPVSGAPAGGTQTLTPPGIASAETLGAPKLNLAIEPTGIASAEAVGQPTLNLEVSPPGIASGQAMGVPQVDLQVRSTGIGSAEVFGTPNVGRQTLAPPGIASGEAVGAPKLNLKVLPTGIASAQALGAPKVNLKVAPAGIASAGAFGTPAVGQAVRPPGIASAQAFGSPTLNLKVSASSIAAAFAAGVPKLNLKVLATGIASAQALGVPKVNLAVKPTGVASAEAEGTPKINLRISATGIASAQAFGSPTVTTPGGAQPVAPPGIASGFAAGSPKVNLKVSVTGIPSAFAAGVPNVGKQTITPTGIASAQAPGSPKVNLKIAPVGIPSAEAPGSPRLNLAARPTGIPSAQALGVPTITQNALQVRPTGVASGEALGSPKVNLRISPAGIPSGQALGTPSVATGTNVAPSGIASSFVAGVPRINQTVRPAGIATNFTAGAPKIGLRVLPTGIASAQAVGAPLVSFRSVFPVGIPSAGGFGTPSVGGGASTPTISVDVAAVHYEVVLAPAMEFEIGLASTGQHEVILE